MSLEREDMPLCKLARFQKKNYLENRKRAGTLKIDQSSTAVILLDNISSKVPAGPTPTTVSLQPVKMDSLMIAPEFIRLTVTSPTRKSYEDFFWVKCRLRY